MRDGHDKTQVTKLFKTYHFKIIQRHKDLNFTASQNRPFPLEHKAVRDPYFAKTPEKYNANCKKSFADNNKRDKSHYRNKKRDVEFGKSIWG